MIKLVLSVYNKEKGKKMVLSWRNMCQLYEGRAVWCVHDHFMGRIYVCLWTW